MKALLETFRCPECHENTDVELLFDGPVEVKEMDCPKCLTLISIEGVFTSYVTFRKKDLLKVERSGDE